MEVAPEADGHDAFVDPFAERKRAEKSAGAFEDRRRTRKAFLCETGGEHAALRSTPGVQALNPRTVLPPLGQTESLRAGDAERAHESVPIEAQTHRGGSGSAKHAAERGRMHAMIKLTAAEHLTQAARHFVSREKRAQKRLAGTGCRFRDGQRRRNDDGARVEDGQTVVIVELKSVGKGAVSQGCVPRRSDPPCTENGRFRLAAGRQNGSQHRGTRRRDRAAERDRHGIERIQTHATSRGVDVLAGRH